jgi:hypothetical protein
VRLLVVSESYQSYKIASVSDELTDVGNGDGGGGCFGGSKSVEEVQGYFVRRSLISLFINMPLLKMGTKIRHNIYTVHLPNSLRVSPKIYRKYAKATLQANRRRFGSIIL